MSFEWLSDLFGGDHPQGNVGLTQIAFRAATMYLTAIVFVRLGKSRLLSRITPVDGVLTFLLGAILGGAVVGTAAMSTATVAVGTLIALHALCTALACWSKWWGHIFKGKAYVLVSNGQIDWDNMRRSHISEDDLKEELRLNANINDLGEVKLAMKERSGSVGIVKKSSVTVTQFNIGVEDGVQTVRIVIQH